MLRHPIKVHIVLLAWLIALPAAAVAEAAQDGSGSTVTVEDLRTPYSPAFVLLGIEPATVERPTNPKALALSAFGAIQNGGNFALEVAPYWLFRHPTLTYEDYYGANTFEVMLQTLSISVATSLNMDTKPSDMSETDSSNATGAGVGARLSVLRGKPDQSDVDTLFAASDKAAERAVALGKAQLKLNKLNAAIEQKQGELKNETDPAAANKLLLQINALMADRTGAEKEMSGIRDDIDKIAKESRPVRERVATAWHRGFTLDVAGGASGIFPSGKSQSGQFQRAGVWFEPGYRADDVFDAPKHESGGVRLNLEVVGIARYLLDHETDKNDLVDLGGRLTAEFPRAVFNSRLALSFEGVKRIVASGPEQSSERLAGIIEYELPEFLQMGNAKYLTATFGQDFDDQTGDNRTIVLFGVNFGFGQDPQVTFERSGGNQG
ncbi:MAG TPA: hypothetical protein VFD92_03235 [Candidatus Binatia bacterium]|nr:hypothetical protein [Candidatus Binatia bacterium]